LKVEIGVMSEQIGASLTNTNDVLGRVLLLLHFSGSNGN
jgi:hypothetical protein